MEPLVRQAEPFQNLSALATPFAAPKRPRRSLARNAPELFTRITWLDFRAHRSDEGFEILERAVVPAMEQLPRCRGVLLLRDPKSGNATLMTLWASRRDVDQFGGLGEAQLDLLYDVLARTPAHEVYEVRKAPV
jgi:hypothetical protein